VSHLIQMGSFQGFDRGSLGFLLCFRGLRAPYFGRVFLSCSERFVSLLYLGGFRPLTGTEGLMFVFDSGYFSQSVTKYELIVPWKDHLIMRLTEKTLLSFPLRLPRLLS
jgi:hypothetical protein